MALINNTKKYIFFHLFKCAGTSMRSILHTNIIDCKEFGGVHSIPRDVKEIMYASGKQNIYDSYFKFTIVRNPFDWMVSTYYYILGSPTHKNYNAIKSMNLEQFINYYTSEMMLNTGVEKGENKCVTLNEFVTDKDDKIILDYIGKYENIANDMKNIVNHIGIPYKSLPVSNVSLGRERDYRKYYTPESIKLVEKYFEKDLNQFNYNF